MRPLTVEASSSRTGEAPFQLIGEPGDVVRHLDVKNADQLLAFGIDRHTGRTDLLAKNRQRVIGERIDVGHVRITDHHINKAVIGAHVLGLADRHSQHDGPIAAADLDRSRLRVGVADHAQNRRCQGNGKRDRKIAQPAATLRGPVLRPPAKADVNFIDVYSRHTPPPLR